MIERLPPAHLPTPIEELNGLSDLLAGPRIFIKRDDLTGLGMGGNKTRKLEYLVSDAISKGCKTLITTGAIQSNHCRQVAAAAARLGLSCILVLAGEEPERYQGNLFLDKLSGAEIVFAEKNKRDQTLTEVFEKASAEGKRPYLIPYGGSNAIGALGYYYAMRELLQQGLDPDWIVFASSSGGTQAGLVIGARHFGFPGKLLGISIEHSSSTFSDQIAQLANQTAELLQFDCLVTPEDILINDQYCLAGYGVITTAETEAISFFAKHGGILLDPVYTGRAAAGLLDLIRNGFFKPSDKILFWHTGGTPALFAEPYSTVLV